MPNLKLTELPTLSPINFTSTDLIYIVDSELNTSNKIPFNLLAGDKLTLLSAYDIQNTTNVDSISSKVSENTTAISTLNGGFGDVNTSLDTLSTKIDSNFFTLSSIQDTKASQTTTNLISSSILELSGKFSTIDEDSGDSFTNAISLSQGTISLTASNDNVTVLDLDLDTFSTPTFTGLTVDGVDIKAAVDTLSSNVDYLSGQIDLKANIASPTFTGTPTAPTAGSGANTTQIATTEFVTAAVAGGSSGGFIPSTYTGQDSLSAPNGLITKFGTVTIPSDSEVTVTFPAPFPNGFVFGVASFSSAFSVTVDAGIGVNSGSTTSMVVRNGAGGSQTASWMAIGY